MVTRTLPLLAAALCLMVALPGGQGQLTSCPPGQAPDSMLGICTFPPWMDGTCTTVDGGSFADVLTADVLFIVPEGATCTVNVESDTEVVAIGSSTTCFISVTFCADAPGGTGCGSSDEDSSDEDSSDEDSSDEDSSGSR